MALLLTTTTKLNSVRFQVEFLLCVGLELTTHQLLNVSCIFLGFVTLVIVRYMYSMV